MLSLDRAENIPWPSQFLVSHTPLQVVSVPVPESETLPNSKPSRNHLRYLRRQVLQATRPSDDFGAMLAL
jgi:hypothetical protein